MELSGNTIESKMTIENEIDLNAKLNHKQTFSEVGIESDMEKSFPLSRLVKVRPVDSVTQLKQIVELRSVKSDEFMFRMRVKLVSCLQQLEIEREQIQNFRKIQNQSQVLNSFVSQVKRQFNELKKLRQSEETRNKSDGNLSMEKLQIISLQNQISEFTQSEKRLKSKLSKYMSENAQLTHQVKGKEILIEQKAHQLYQNSIEFKECQSTIDSLRTAQRRKQKQWKQQREELQMTKKKLQGTLNQEKEVSGQFRRKMEDSQLEKLQASKMNDRLKGEIEILLKENLKWKERCQWEEKDTIAQNNNSKKQISLLQETIKKQRMELENLQVELKKVNNQKNQISATFNKKLENIVQEWKSKLISNVEDYEDQIQSYTTQISHLEESLDSERKRLNQVFSSIDGLKKQLGERENKIASKEGQLSELVREKDLLSKKIKELQKTLSEMKQQNSRQTERLRMQFKHQIETFQSERSKLMEQNKTRVNEISELKQKESLANQRHEQTVELKNQQIKKLSQLVAANEEKFLKRISELQILSKDQLDKKREAFDEVNEKYEALKRVKDEFVKKNERLELQIEQSQKKYENLKLEIKRLGSNLFQNNKALKSDSQTSLKEEKSETDELVSPQKSETVFAASNFKQAEDSTNKRSLLQSQGSYSVKNSKSPDRSGMPSNIKRMFVRTDSVSSSFNSAQSPNFKP